MNTFISLRKGNFSFMLFKNASLYHSERCSDKQTKINEVQTKHRCGYTSVHHQAITYTHILNPSEQCLITFDFFPWMQQRCVVLICSINKNSVSHNPSGPGTAALIHRSLAVTLSQPACCAQRASHTLHTGRPAPALYYLNTIWPARLALRLQSACFRIPAHSGGCMCFQMRYAGKQPTCSDVKN